MKDLFSKVKSNALLKNTLKLSASNVALMFLPLLVIPILSRLYTPEDYGVWGVFSGVLFIFNSFIFLSYENTIVKSNEETEIPNLLVLCILISLLICILVSTLFFVGNALGINFFLKFPSVFFLFFALVSSAFFTLGICISNRFKKYGIMSFVNTVNGLSQAIIRIVLGLIPLLGYGLIVGNILAHVIASVILIFMLLSSIRTINWRNLSWKNIVFVLKKYKKFPLFDAPARLIEFTVGNIVIIILSFYFGENEIGCFSIVMQFILLPIAVIGSAMGNVYYRELSEKATSDELVKDITKKAARISLYLALLPILFLSAGGDKLLVLFLGEKWISAGMMALCMTIYSVPVILSEPLLPIFRVLDKQEVRFKFNIINLIISIGALIASSLLFYNIYISLLTYSICYSLIRFIIYNKIITLAGLTLKEIDSKGKILIFICYSILVCRLCFEL